MKAGQPVLSNSGPWHEHDTYWCGIINKSYLSTFHSYFLFLQTAFSWPQMYSFPPFFTKQLNRDTEAKRVQVWRDLISSYCWHHAIFVLDINESTTSSPFCCNSTVISTISCGLIKADILEMILQMMVSAGNPESWCQWMRNMKFNKNYDILEASIWMGRHNNCVCCFPKTHRQHHDDVWIQRRFVCFRSVVCDVESDAQLELHPSVCFRSVVCDVESDAQFELHHSQLQS